MNKIGVVLAGGKSTRLNNKILLPMNTESMDPIICSGLDMLLRSSIKTIYVLDKEVSILEPMLKKLGYNNLIFRRDNFDGILYCMNQLALENPSALFYIVCADNIYPPTEVWNPHKECVITRMVDGRDAVHLTTMENGFWYPAGYSDSLLALTTPWFIKAETFLDNHYCISMTEFLTKTKMPFHVVERAGWADLGTEDTYIRHWNND